MPGVKDAISPYTRGDLVRFARLAVAMGIRLGDDVRLMVDTRYLERISSMVVGEDVFEIGFGLGYLTHYLSAKARYVAGCDINPLMYRAIRVLGVDVGDADLFICDALSYTPPRQIVVVSNMPYSITTPLLLRLLISYNMRRGILTLQREVAERLTARAGSRNYGRLSVIAQCMGIIRIVEKIPPSAFIPSPKVYSAIVEITPFNKPCGDIDAIQRLTSKLFTQPNKKVSKVLGQFYGVEPNKIPEDIRDKRVRGLSINDILRLIRILGNT